MIHRNDCQINTVMIAKSLKMLHNRATQTLTTETVTDPPASAVDIILAATIIVRPVRHCRQFGTKPIPGSDCPRRHRNGVRVNLSVNSA